MGNKAPKIEVEPIGSEDDIWSSFENQLFLYGEYAVKRGLVSTNLLHDPNVVHGLVGQTLLGALRRKPEYDGIQLASGLGVTPASVPAERKRFLLELMKIKKKLRGNKWKGLAFSVYEFQVLERIVLYSATKTQNEIDMPLDDPQLASKMFVIAASLLAVAKQVIKFPQFSARLPALLGALSRMAKGRSLWHEETDFVTGETVWIHTRSGQKVTEKPEEEGAADSASIGGKANVGRKVGQTLGRKLFDLKRQATGLLGIYDRAAKRRGGKLEKLEPPSQEELKKEFADKEEKFHEAVMGSLTNTEKYFDIKKHSFFGGKDYSLFDLLSHTKHHLKQSLTLGVPPGDDGAEETFLLVRQHMGDHKHGSAETGNFQALLILQTGQFGSEAMRDEIYALLIKQTTANPDRQSLLKGWELWALCAGTFGPSEAFYKDIVQPFLDVSVEHHDEDAEIVSYMRYAQDHVARSIAQGPRVFRPSAQEIDAVRALRSLWVRVDMMDHTHGNILVGAQTTVGSACAKVAEEAQWPGPPPECAPGVPLIGMFQVASENGVFLSETSIKDDSRALDVVTGWVNAQEAAQARLEESFFFKKSEDEHETSVMYRFVLKIKMFVPGALSREQLAAPYLQLLYAQAWKDVAHGVIPTGHIPRFGGLSQDEMLNVSAMAAKCELGDVTPEAMAMELERFVSPYTLAKLMSADEKVPENEDKEQREERVEKARATVAADVAARASKLELEGEDLKWAIVEELSKTLHFGAQVFGVSWEKMCMGKDFNAGTGKVKKKVKVPHLPRNYILGVCSRGVLYMDDGNRSLKKIHLFRHIDEMGVSDDGEVFWYRVGQKGGKGAVEPRVYFLRTDFAGKVLEAAQLMKTKVKGNKTDFADLAKRPRFNQLDAEDVGKAHAGACSIM